MRQEHELRHEHMEHPERQEENIQEADASLQEEEQLIPNVPHLKYITKALTLLHSEPRSDGSFDPEKHWTRLHERVTPWETGLELSDNIRAATREFIAEKMPKLKEAVPSIEDLSDKKLLEALVHNWFEGIEEEVGGQRREVLLTVMAHVVKRIETVCYKKILQNASEQQLESLGIDPSVRDLLMGVLDISSKADPLFVRFLAYTQLSGEPPKKADSTSLFLPKDKTSHTIAKLFPKETRVMARRFADVAAQGGEWMVQEGGSAFAEYLRALSALYAAKDPREAKDAQKNVEKQYERAALSGFPIIITPALEGYTKEPYLDPELRVSLSTKDVAAEEQYFRAARDGMASELHIIGAEKFAKAMREKDLRSVVAFGSYGVNLVFNTVAQEDPFVMMYVNEQIRQYDKSFCHFADLVTNTADVFDTLPEEERIQRMQRMSRVDTMLHENGHAVAGNRTSEARRLGTRKAYKTINEIKAENVYRPLIPALVEKGVLEGTREQWAVATLVSSLQILRDQSPGDPYYHATVHTLNELFERSVVVFQEGKFTITDYDAYFDICYTNARAVLEVYEDPHSSEKKAAAFIKRAATPNKVVQEVEVFMKGLSDEW